MSRFPRTPRGVAELTRRHANPMWGVYGGTTLGGSAAVADRGRDRRSLAGGVAGAAGGQLAFQGVEHVIGGRAAEQRRQVSRPQDKKRREHMRSHGINPAGGREFPGNEDPRKWQRAWNTYPEDLPGSKLTRRVARFGGRKGWLIGAGATTAGGVAGASALRHRKVGKRLEMTGPTVSVGKAERGVRRRQAEMIGGASLLSYGGARLPMVGSGLRHGAANEANSQAVRNFYTRLEGARATTEDYTGRGALHARRLKAVGEAVDRIPRHLRPGLAAAAGGLLMTHAHPIRRDGGRVRINIGSGRPVTGW